MAKVPVYINSDDPVRQTQIGEAEIEVTDKGLFATINFNTTAGKRISGIITNGITTEMSVFPDEKLGRHSKDD